MSLRRTDARVRAVAGRRLEPDEEIVGWTRAWYSRAARRTALQPFAARYRDIVVLTNRRLMLWEVGMITRRPRRRVLADRLDQLTVEAAGPAGTDSPVSRVRFSKPAHRAMLLEFGSETGLASELLDRAGRRVDSPQTSETQTPETQPIPEDAP